MKFGINSRPTFENIVCRKCEENAVNSESDEFGQKLTTKTRRTHYWV